MGRDQSGPGWLEFGVSKWLCRFFTDHNVTHEYQEIESGRGNVIARLEGSPDRPVILLDAHQDTVPVDGMTIDPYQPVVRDRRLYGRGACDVKGAMASMLSALVRLSQQPAESRSSVIVSLTCDEELGQMGALDLVRRIGDGDRLLSPAPDMAIVAEPTSLDVVVAHKGVVRWEIETQGVAVHSSRPNLGTNAIYAMAEVIGILQQIANQIGSAGLEHPLCGRPSLSVGTIHGGSSVNIVPDHCVIEIDRRVVPGESVQQILRETERQLLEQCSVAFEMLPPGTKCGPLVDGPNQSLAGDLSAIASRVAGSSDTIGVAFTTQAPKFADAGIPTVVFGPGSIDQAHTKDEWIEIEQLDQSAEILYEFITKA